MHVCQGGAQNAEGQLARAAACLARLEQERGWGPQRQNHPQGSRASSCPQDMLGASPVAEHGCSVILSEPGTEELP